MLALADTKNAKDESGLISFDEVKEHVADIRQLHAPVIGDRVRTRSIMDGGAAGLKQLLGKNIDIGDEVDMPVVHLMFSGLERLGQKLSAIPDVRSPIPDHIDSTTAKKVKAKLARICESYDEIGVLELQMLEQARWVPGYGYGVWIIREIEVNRQRYPVAQLRDPFNSYPGHWGVDRRPSELVTVRTVPGRTLRRAYPKHADKFDDDHGPATGSMMVNDMGQVVWDSPGANVGFSVIDFYDNTGTYVYVEETDTVLERIPNPLSLPRFVVPHRPSFNALIGQFRHSLGTMAMMAKLNVLAGAAFEDGVNTETNIFGQLRSNEYEKGRFATNELEVNARVEKPSTNVPYQLFEQIDRLERQIRLSSGYPITDDAESPNSFVTGRGLEELNAGSSRIVNEYQIIFRHALQELDALRLEWDQEFYGSGRKSLFGVEDGTPYSELYVPTTDIKGQFRTQREYGMMASFDDPTKIVTGTQLLEAGVIDVETMQYNLRGLRNIPKINERIKKAGVESQLIAALGQRFAEGDPNAGLTLIAMYENPGKFEEELKRYHTPQEPQVSPEEEQMLAAAQAQQGGGGPGGAPTPDITTTLSRLNQDGSSQGGLQTVRTRKSPSRRQ